MATSWRRMKGKHVFERCDDGPQLARWRSDQSRILRIVITLGLKRLYSLSCRATRLLTHRRHASRLGGEPVNCQRL